MTTEHVQRRYGPPLPTPEEARAAGRMGHNLQCNRCGGYGASWIPGMRPGWGALALCYPDKAELVAEQNRHAKAMAKLTAVNFK